MIYIYIICVCVCAWHIVALRMLLAACTATNIDVFLFQAGCLCNDRFVHQTLQDWTAEFPELPSAQRPERSGGRTGRTCKVDHGWSWLIMVDQSWSINIDIILISNIFQHYPTLCIYSPFSSKVIPESSSSSVCPSSAAQEKPTCSLQVVSMTCSTTCKLLRTRGSTRNQGISRPATLDLSKVRRPARWCDLSCERLWITGWHLWYPWYPSPGTGPKLWYASLNMTPGLAPFLVAN